MRRQVDSATSSGQNSSVNDGERSNSRGNEKAPGPDDARSFFPVTDTVPRPESPRNRSHRLTQPWKVQPPYLLTIGEAAAVLGFTEGTVRRYCDRGLIGYLTWRWRYGIIARARRYIPKAAAQEFLQRRAARRLR
jgi:hypothetical protein